MKLPFFEWNRLCECACARIEKGANIKIVGYKFRRLCEITLIYFIRKCYGEKVCELSTWLCLVWMNVAQIFSMRFHYTRVCSGLRASNAKRTTLLTMLSMFACKPMWSTLHLEFNLFSIRGNEEVMLCTSLSLISLIKIHIFQYIVLNAIHFVPLQ